jgi:hypothetical protein
LGKPFQATRFPSGDVTLFFSFADFIGIYKLVQVFSIPFVDSTTLNFGIDGEMLVIKKNRSPT